MMMFVCDIDILGRDVASCVRVYARILDKTGLIWLVVVQSAAAAARLRFRRRQVRASCR